jgi:hypothetical protein
MKLFNINTEAMHVFHINTTAFEEEDFILLTDLSKEEVVSVIMPIVNAERDGYEEYDNEDLINALNKTYPNNTSTMVVLDEVVI